VEQKQNMLEIIIADSQVVSADVSALSTRSLSLDIMLWNIIAYGHTQSTHTSISLMLTEVIRNTWLFKKNPWMSLCIVIVYSWEPNA
jgi:hypothetical protein